MQTMMIFVLILTMAGESSVVDYGLSLEDCRKIAVQAPELFTCVLDTRSFYR